MGHWSSHCIWHAGGENGLPMDICTNPSYSAKHANLVGAAAKSQGSQKSFGFILMGAWQRRVLTTAQEHSEQDVFFFKSIPPAIPAAFDIKYSPNSLLWGSALCSCSSNPINVTRYACNEATAPTSCWLACASFSEEDARAEIKLH